MRHWLVVLLSIVPVVHVGAQPARTVSIGDRVKIVTRNLGAERQVVGTVTRQASDTVILFESAARPETRVVLSDITATRVSVHRASADQGFLAGAAVGGILSLAAHALGERTEDRIATSCVVDIFSGRYECRDRPVRASVDKTPKWVTPTLIGGLGAIGALTALRERWAAAVFAAPTRIVGRVSYGAAFGIGGRRAF